MKTLKVLVILTLVGTVFTVRGVEADDEIFYPQVPFNFLYAGGIECAFIRVYHPQWDAVEFMTTASGGINLMISLVDGVQIHYLNEEHLVQMRKKFDTSSTPRDYRYAPMEYSSEIGADGRVEITYSARTDLGELAVDFFSSDSLKEMNRVVDPLNHAMEVIPILYLEKTVDGDERTSVLVDDTPFKIKSSSFTLGANYGIIFRTDRRIENLKLFTPGRRGLVGARWIYDLEEMKASYSISKDLDSEGYYEVKRLLGFVQKAWMRPAKGGREVRRISTYSLVHEYKEFIVEFNPPLFFPTTTQGKPSIQGQSDFRARISNSGWDVGGNVRIISKGEAHKILHIVEFLPTFPAFLAKRPAYYCISESPDRYEVITREEG